MARMSAHVRPTRRTLADLGQPLPDLGTPLDEIDDGAGQPQGAALTSIMGRSGFIDTPPATR